jgi:energy-coupling factor transporter ATP-binding protein EcfA2
MVPSRFRLPLLIILIFGPLIALSFAQSFGLSFEQLNLIRENPIVSIFGAIAYSISVFAVLYANAVFEELRKRWVKSTADWIDTEVRLFLSGFLKRYYQHLIYRHRVFNVRGLRTQGTFTLELQNVFVDLVISAQNPQALTASLLQEGNSSTKLSIWKLLSSNLDSYKTLAIIGPPGSGKTTLLQYIVLTFAQNRQLDYDSHLLAYVPIFLFLRDHKQRILADHPSLAELATEQESNLHPPSNWFQRLLERKKCLVLLDGLDEVADEKQRRIVVEWVDKQIELYGGNRFLVTSRPFGYRTTPLKTATVLEVQPFSIEQVKQFVENWYLANEILSFGKDDPGVRETASKSAADMMHRLRAAPPLAALAINPLLLTMITMVHRYRGALPGRRVELYSEICEVLLGHWRSAVGLVDPLTSIQKRSVLQPLALYLMRNKRREISTKEAIDVLREPLKEVGRTDNSDPIKFLEEIEKQSGIMLERELGEYTFAHLTFQEFLASMQILETHKDSLLLDNVEDPWWHETIRLYAAQTNATSVVQACLGKSRDNIITLTLAYEISTEARSIDPAIRDELNKTLVAEQGSSDPERQRLGTEVMLARRLGNLLRISKAVEIDSSYITCAEYQLFINEKQKLGEYHQPDHWSSMSFPKEFYHYPVTGVRPSDARAFCDWLTERNIAGPNVHYRLPSPTEVEKNPVEISASEVKGTIEGQKVGAWCNTHPSLVLGLRSQKLDILNFALISAIERNTILVRKLAIALTHCIGQNLSIEDTMDSTIPRELSLVRELGQALEHNATYESVSNFQAVQDLIRRLTFDLVLAQGRKVLGDTNSDHQVFGIVLDQSRIIDLLATLVNARELCNSLALVSDIDRQNDLCVALSHIHELAQGCSSDIIRDTDDESIKELARTLKNTHDPLYAISLAKLPLLRFSQNLDLDIDRLCELESALDRARNLESRLVDHTIVNLEAALNIARSREFDHVANNIRGYRHDYVDLSSQLSIAFARYAWLFQNAIIDHTSIKEISGNRKTFSKVILEKERDECLFYCLSLSLLRERVSDNFAAWESICVVRETLQSENL